MKEHFEGKEKLVDSLHDLIEKDADRIAVLEADVKRKDETITDVKRKVKPSIENTRPLLHCLGLSLCLFLIQAGLRIRRMEAPYFLSG